MINLQVLVKLKVIMLPVVTTIGGWPVTSFGLFLILAFLAALFAVWRAAQVYEIDPEKLFDIFFLTIISGFIVARLYFVLFHPGVFDTPLKIVLLNRYPGLSFWGGLAGGLLALGFFTRRLKLDFWLIFDLAGASFLLAKALASIGCLLGSCEYGTFSNAFYAVSQAGVIGKRLPVQALESAAFMLVFLYLWKNLLRFHYPGVVGAKTLMAVAMLKLIFEPFRAEVELIPSTTISIGYIWSAVLVVAGLAVYYKRSKRQLGADLKYLASLFTSSTRRRNLVLNLRKSWYNLSVSLRLGLKNWRKNFFRFANIRSNPSKF